MRRPRVLLLLLALVLGLAALGGHDLWAPDEPYFAEGAREMIADGHWAVPHVNGEITTDKPALFFWLIALASLPGGAVTALTARLPSALAGLVALLLTLRLGRRMGSESSALWAGLILVTTFLFWDKARSAQIDATLCVLVLVALTAFEAWRSGRLRGVPAAALFGGAEGLAVLAKGPVGLLVPGFVVVVTLALDGPLRDRQGTFWGVALAGVLLLGAFGLGPLALLAVFLFALVAAFFHRRLRRARAVAGIGAGLGIFAAVVALWFAAVTLGADGYSVAGALREHVLDRGLEGMHHAQPPWYFLGTLPVDLLPWTGLLPGALLLAWRRRRNREDRFLLSWLLAVFLFFTAFVEKRGLYLLPAFPALALLLGRLADHVTEAARSGTATLVHRRWLTLGQGLVALPLLVAGAGLPLLALAGIGAGQALSGQDVDLGEALKGGLLGPVLAASLVMLAGGLALALAALRGRSRTVMVATASTAASLFLCLAVLVYPAVNERKSARPLALRVKEATIASREAGHPVATFGLGNLPEALAFYTDGVYFPKLDGTRDLVEHLSSGGEVYVVADARRLRRLPLEARARYEVVFREQVSRRPVVLIRGLPPGAAPALPRPAGAE